MDFLPSSINICRLCLQRADEPVNIWEKFQESTIASILEEHFYWFQFHGNDGSGECLCGTCWINTKAFHEFYIKVEIHHKVGWQPAEKNYDETISSNDPASETLFSIIKCEETELAIHSNVKNEYSCNEENAFDVVGESSKAASDEDETTEQISNNDKAEGSLGSLGSPPKMRKKVTKKEQDARIGEFFLMKCDMCSYVELESFTNLQKHYRKVHETIGYLTCCQKKWQRRSEILRHMDSHNENSRNERDEQDAQIREFFSMKCDLCNDDVTFKTMKEVKQHYTISHKVKGYQRCCEKKFWVRRQLLDHIRQHTDPEYLRCKECGKVCKSKYSLQIHIAHHAPLDSRPHKCTLCTSSFQTAPILRLHVKSRHAPTTGELLPCNHCGKSYRSKSILATHIRLTHESLPIVCEVCARQFKSKHTLQLHLDAEHSATPQPKVQCDICGNWLKNKAQLAVHKKRHQNGNNAVQCPICNETLENKTALKRHKKKHTERKNICNLCSMAFWTNKQLKEHIAVHTGEDLYNCTYCDRKTKSSANMYSHVKKAHYDEWARDNPERAKLKRKFKTEESNDVDADV